MDETRKCPYCAEDIRAEAVRCPYCRSRVAVFDAARWYRDHPERRVAGVTAAVAHALAFPVTAVRVGFVLLTFIHLLGPILYGALWLITPFAPGGRTSLDRALAAVEEWIASVRRRRPGPPPRARNGADRDDGFELVSGGPLP
jgi:phage shock protein PspC (stress-responsive transcriptional regulator)